jgi:hypothetical protein
VMCGDGSGRSEAPPVGAALKGEFTLGWGNGWVGS